MKKFFCDKCGEEVWFLYDLCTLNGIKSLCQQCYYGIKIDNLCTGTPAECGNCDKC